LRQKSLLRSVKKECRGKRLSTREQLTAIRIVTLKEKNRIYITMPTLRFMITFNFIIPIFNGRLMVGCQHINILSSQSIISCSEPSILFLEMLLPSSMVAFGSNSAMLSCVPENPLPP